MDLSIVYASKADYTEYTGIAEADLPSNIDTLLRRASERVTMLVHRNYDPLKPSHVDATKYAVCAEVYDWVENNDGNPTDNNEVQSYSLGNISVSLSPVKKEVMNNISMSYLRSACLLYKGV